jgi:branched-chain amino acid transport system ATP-binding protein
MAKPDFILLDEPSLGLAPLMVADVMNAVPRISGDFGIGALIIEQNASVALDVASRAYGLCPGEGQRSLTKPARSVSIRRRVRPI